MDPNLTRTDWDNEAADSDAADFWDLRLALDVTKMLESLRDIEQAASTSELFITRKALRFAADEANSAMWRERFTTAADAIQDIMEGRIKAYTTCTTFDTPGAVADILGVMGEFDTAAIKAKLEELG